MKNRKRALRRHHRQRMIAHARRTYVFYVFSGSEAAKQEWLCRNYNNLKKCSCWMCGNPRKWYGLPPIQERRYNQGIRYGDS